MLIHVLEALIKAYIAGYCWGGGLLEFWSIHYLYRGLLLFICYDMSTCISISLIR